MTEVDFGPSTIQALANALRLALEDALKPVVDELELMNTQLSTIETDLEILDSDLSSLQADLASLRVDWVDQFGATAMNDITDAIVQAYHQVT